MKFPRSLRLILSSLIVFLTPAGAQETSPEIENHSAVKVVKEYLKCMLEQDWVGSSKLVEPKSLSDLRDDYVKRVKNTASLDEEKMVVEKFKVEHLEDIEKMSGIDFYTSYHRLLKDRAPVEPSVLKKVRDTMKLRVLSLAMETDKLCHILVRTKHNNDRVTVESMEVLSLVKMGDKWMVGLNEQTPKVTPLAGAGAPVGTPEATPAPSPSPAKEAPKPAPTKATETPKPKKR